MARLGQLREQAKSLGIPGRLIRGAETAEELQSVIDDHSAHENGAEAKPRKKSQVRKASSRTVPRKKSTVAKAKVKPSNERKRTVTSTTNNYSRWSISRLKNELASRGISAGRGRPSVERYAGLLEADDGGTKTKPKPKAKPTKTTTTKRKPVRKASKASTRKATTRKSTTKARKSSYQAKGARHLIDDVDFSQDDGWNPRPGSAPDRIIKALKRKRGNRVEAFKLLVPDVRDFVNPKMANGTRRSKEDMEEMLRYRISRTLWDFAMRTGQHEAAGNRAEYGTAGTGSGIFKPKKAVAKRGRPKGSKNSTTRKPPARKASSRATKTTTRKRSATRK